MSMHSTVPYSDERRVVSLAEETRVRDTARAIYLARHGQPLRGPLTLCPGLVREARAALDVADAGRGPGPEIEAVVLRRVLEDMPATYDPRGWLDARLHRLEHPGPGATVAPTNPSPRSRP